MGIIKQGILGAFSGKVGAVVGSSWKGIAVMKARPASVANPRTAGQVTQRNAMSRAVSFAQPILGEILKPLNDRFASRMSGYNLFIQRNIEEFKDPENFEPANISISPRVNKAQLIDAIACDPGQNRIKVSWNSDEGQGFALATDIPFVVVLDVVNNRTFGWRGVRTRGDDFTVGNVPEGFEVADLGVFWLAFLRADGTVVFATAYNDTPNAMATVDEVADAELGE